MNGTRSLLVELFVEELPPKSLKKLGDAFAQSLSAGLKAQGLLSDRSATTSYATPRRLAVHISAVLAQAADRAVTHKLMPVAVALDAAGSPTPTLLKKLAAIGADASAVPQLERKPDGKGDALFWTTTVRGAMLAAGLQAALDETLRTLPIPKVMSYQLADGWTSVNFVRPAHGLVALHGAEVVPVAALGLQSGRSTQGHRFEAQVDPLLLQDADHYAQQLEQQGAVIAAFDHRRADIVRQLQHAAAPLGLTPIDDDALLDEVTALVERPNVLLCQFEPEFLAVPSECLILTMKVNQKYFPLLDAQGRLTHRFLVVSNIRPEDASAIVQGNERVVRPRLADAKFFFDQDRKKTLESRLPLLDKVVYHAKLGSQRQRVERVRQIARAIGEQLGGVALAAQADRAAQLAKADLVTDMVGEFPELQGVMGGYYARHDGETEAAAFAVEDHYKPRFAGDALPRNEVGIAVALADKLETLVGLFGVGEKPTGDKDPFALRRHALGIVRLLSEKAPELAFDALLATALDRGLWPEGWHLVHKEGAGLSNIRDQVSSFVRERFANALRESGASASEVEALLEGSLWWQIGEIPARLAAVRAFEQLPESAALAASNKRIANILKKSNAHGSAHHFAAHLLQEPAEKDLATGLQEVAPRAQAYFADKDFTANLSVLATLGPRVDAFFETVMVNSEDDALRRNRLALLDLVFVDMNRVADLSKLAR